MSTLKQSVVLALESLHGRNGKEWLSLNEIYDEVEKITKRPLKNGGASVRAILERGCALSDVFDGKELFISKGIRSGFYKSKKFDFYKEITNLRIGSEFSRKELTDFFKISGQSGIMKTNTYDCLVLTTSQYNGVYEDSSIENGTLLYTGEGMHGDQTITKNNKTIYESRKTNIPMYLFSKTKDLKYVFEGRVELYDDPFQINETDVDGNNRLVWKFPLAIADYETYEYESVDSFDSIVYEIEQVENSIDLQDSLICGNLEFREGKVNIRRYQKSIKKHKRGTKPDYIANEIIKTKNGELNEKIIYENELKKLIEKEAFEEVKKMEDFFENRVDNEGYDILSFELDDNGEYIEKYIEVKSTIGSEKTPIDITAEEIEFAKKHVDNYYIYRIVNNQKGDAYYKIISGKDLFNDHQYELVPTSYRIYNE